MNSKPEPIIPNISSYQQIGQIKYPQSLTAKRKPIFQCTPDKHHHISIQSSQVVRSLKGDQTFPYELEKINQQLDEQVKEKSNHKKNNWIMEQNSDQESIDLSPRSPFQYFSLQVPLAKTQLSIRQDQHQKMRCLEKENNNSIIQIKLQRLQIQNQTLKNHQILLTQMLLSNQKKLRNLEQLQKVQALNKQYEKKINNAKNAIQKWEGQNKNNRIIKQLITILTY